MIHRSKAVKFLIPMVLAMQGMQAHAVEVNPQVLNKHAINTALQLQITPRGMKYFERKLDDVLGNLGINLDEGYFPSTKYAFTTPINVDDYAKTNPDMVAMYNQVRTLLSQWLVGFSLNPHLPQIEIGDSGYVAQFSRFGLLTDEALMKSLGKTEGAVLAIEMEVQKLTIATNSVVVSDLNNSFLGEAGFKDATLQIGGGKVPLRIRLPFYVRMNTNGGLIFEALDVTNNLDQVDVAFKYQKLLVPTFAIEVNGKKFYMNTDELEKYFNQQTPMIISKIRDSLGDFARKQLPAMLTEKVQQMVNGSLEQVQTMPVPGKEDKDPRPDFKWGIQLQNIGLNNTLNIDLGSYVEDETNVLSQPRKADAARGPTTLNLLTPDKFDVALSVDRGLINRILQLSFERKNFDAVDIGGGDKLKLTTAPTLDYTPPLKGVTLKPQETFVKMNVSVENQPDSSFLTKTIVLNFDIIAKLTPSPKGELNLDLYKIDEESMKMDDKYYFGLGKLIKGIVRDKIKDRLRDQCKTWTTQEKTIGTLPLPPKVFGINLVNDRVLMDQTGHLVMYLDYAKAGVK